MTNKDQEMKDPTPGASGSLSSWSRFPLSSLKLVMEIFDGTGHFGMWQGEVLDSLFQQDLDIAIEEKKPEKELNGGVFYMGNDNLCKTTRIGSIKLRNHDGSTRVLRDVRYVPKLKKNLISVGAFESKGLVVTRWSS
ncbi:hypothetical protein FXO37_13856 [Capsicum annuum]|nr:hypothetical protein FXO37_13856 [Capsicum annuum]